ncbi:SH3 domain-containing protein [Streptomyces triticagri]
MSVPAAVAAASESGAVRLSGARDFCRITASSATVRATPSKGGRPVGTAYKGDACTASGWAGRGGVWVRVRIHRTGVSGYVHSSLVSWGKEGLTEPGRR